jgi:Dimethlysulfonioproprionate lyase
VLNPPVSMADASQPIQALAGWLAVLIDDAAEPPPVARAAFRDGLARIADAARDKAGRVAGGGALPVLRHWPLALELAGAGAAAPAVPWLRALAPALGWTQNPNYRASPPSPDFLANYGYAQLAGPARVPTLVETAACAFGLLLLGPGLLYPAHRHPAVELYLPLTPGDWQRGEEPWRPVAAGTPIHHPSGLAHATRAGAGPLLALYLWQGDLATHARIGSGRMSPARRPGML